LRKISSAKPSVTIFIRVLLNNFKLSLSSTHAIIKNYLTVDGIVANADLGVLSLSFNRFVIEIGYLRPQGNRKYESILDGRSVIRLLWKTMK